MKKKIKKVVLFILILVASIMIVGSFYYKKNYSKQNFETIIFYLTSGAEYTSPAMVNEVIKKCAIPVILTMILIWIPTSQITKTEKNIKFKIKNKIIKIRVYPINFIIKHKKIYIFIIYIIAICCVIFNFKIDKYIINNTQETHIYEEQYVDGKKLNITFPENKKNLIIIMVESLENTVCAKEVGGVWEYSIIPELEKLAMENINFSHNDVVGGANIVLGADYTAGGMVALTSGIPLKITNANFYDGTGKYLQPVYTLGDILKENGYNLEIMMGSDGKFGGRTQYFNTNGDYKIFDLNYALENNYMSESERKWWGFTDEKLIEWSKEEITKLSEDEKPFNYIILTADTHFVDGYLSENAPLKFNSQYENVHAYSSKLIAEFVEWIKLQDFYENTTIVITGDHLGMQEDFYSKYTPNGYERTIYNCIINSSISTENTKNRRFFSGDLFPTMLASIGVEIPGERLGLGTNLFSNTPTLFEELGYEYVANELTKKSDYYNKQILGDDYYLQQSTEEKEICMY